jgi:hypothetical protein
MCPRFVKSCLFIIHGSVAGKHLKLKRGQKEVSQTVYVSFTITENGKLINPFIVNAGEVHKKIPEETLRVINSSPGWWPAKYKGVAYASQMYLPVVYVVSSH